MPSYSSEPTVTISAIVTMITDKAIRIDIGLECHWIPKSQVVQPLPDTIERGVQNIELTGWIASQKGIE